MYTKYYPLGLPDSNWQAKTEMSASRIHQLLMEEALSVPHVDAAVTVDDEGLMWLSSHDAIRAGAGNDLTLAETDVITIGPPDERESYPDGNFYEVIAYVNDKRAYWVRPLRVPDHA
jgi:hypothetical protein